MTEVMQQTEPLILTLAGKKYRTTVATMIRQDHAIHAILYELEIVNLTSGEGEAADEFAHRVFNRMTCAGRFGDLLSCILIPDELRDTDWTPEVSKVTASFLMKLSDPEDKQQIEDVSLGLLINFLRAASVFSERSHVLSASKSLSRSANLGDARGNSLPWSDAKNSLDSGSLDSGTQLSGPSRITTLWNSIKFLASQLRRPSGHTNKQDEKRR